MTDLAVAAPNQHAAQAGAWVADRGGNACDAALAAMFVAMVAEPGIVSVASGAYLTVAEAGQAPWCVDGNVTMPTLPEGRTWPVHTSYGGGTTMEVGPGTVGVPGAVRAFASAHEKAGHLPWADIVQPAIDVAREGFAVSPASHEYLRQVATNVYGWDPHSAAMMARVRGTDDFAVGSIVHLPELADSLAQLASVGPHWCYSGEFADAFIADQRLRQGRVTAADLAQYQAIVAPAVEFDCQGWQIAVSDTQGGRVVQQLLTGKAAAAQAGVAVPWAQIHAQVLGIDQVGDWRTRVPTKASSPSTVHISAVDRSGLACSVTASSGYGSGMVVPGTGIQLNNCLGELELAAEQCQPGDRLTSNMAPVVLRRGDQVVALGSPGAQRIPTAIAQVAWQVLQGQSPQAAVAAPRAHVIADAPGGPVAALEPGADPAPGLATKTWPGQSMFFGGVGVAARCGDGALAAAADPRRGGGTYTSVVS